MPSTLSGPHSYPSKTGAELLIAATALCHDLVLLTRNMPHVGRIAGPEINRLPAPQDGNGGAARGIT